MKVKLDLADLLAGSQGPPRRRIREHGVNAITDLESAYTTQSQPGAATAPLNGAPPPAAQAVKRFKKYANYALGIL